MNQLKYITRLGVIVLLLLSSYIGNSFGSIKDKPFTVVIDPGHGGHDNGAKGAKLKEKDINLAVALLLSDYIKENNSDVNIIFTRKTDVFIPLIERADIANKAKADLFISVHTNATKKNKTPYGVETFVIGMSKTEENLDVAKSENSVILLESNYDQIYAGFDPNSSESYIMFEFMQNKYIEQSIAFASDIQKEFRNTGKRNDRGVKQAEFIVLWKTAMPSVLVELGFISNTAEEKYLGSNQGQRMLARCIYNAFKKFKHEHDRKKGVQIAYSESTVEPVMPEKESKDTTVKPQSVKSSGTIYKVQIMTSPKMLPKSSPKLKGYKNASYFVENGVFKYTCGETSSWDEISKLRKSLLKDFKDAFIITFINGNKQPVK